jgi:hypothetical protein
MCCCFMALTTEPSFFMCVKFGIDEIQKTSTNVVNGLCGCSCVVSISVTLQGGDYVIWHVERLVMITVILF